MKRSDVETRSAFSTRDIFSDLRAVMRGVGLSSEEEKFGLGVYAVFASRFFANPLRLAIREQTEGSADYIVRTVARLFPSDSFLELTSGAEHEWERFKQKPENKTLYLPEGDGEVDERYGPANRIRFDIGIRQITRVTSSKNQGRVVEKNDAVEAAVACISADHRFDPGDAPRWLTMVLDRAKQESEQGAHRLSTKEIAKWHRVQEVLTTRAKLGVTLPDWTDVVIEQAAGNCRSARNLPAFLQAWRTITLLCSLESTEPEMHQASFENFAATGLLLKKVFREGASFPSIKKVFNRITKAGERTAVVHPVTGKGVSYKHDVLSRVQWEPVI